MGVLFRDLLFETSRQQLIQCNNKENVLPDNVLEQLYENVKSFFKQEIFKKKTENFDSILITMAIDEELCDDENLETYFVVYGYDSKNETKLYSLFNTTWSDYYYFYIKQECIDVFGKEACILAVLSEMNLYGNSALKNSLCIKAENDKIEVFSARNNNCIKILSVEEILSYFDKDKYDIFDLEDDRTIAEIEADNKNFERVFIINHVLLHAFINKDEKSCNEFNYDYSLENKKNVKNIIKYCRNSDLYNQLKNI